MWPAFLCAPLLFAANGWFDVTPPPRDDETPSKRRPVGDIPDAARNTSDANPSMEQLISNLHWYGTGILVLTALLLAGELCIMVRFGKSWEDWNSLRVVILTLVIGVGAFLVVAGYGATQTGTITGILGAVVGYLFGKDATRGAAPTS
jgi:hypothetical protein